MMSNNFDESIDSKIDENIMAIMEKRNIKSSDNEPPGNTDFHGRNILLYGVPGSGKSFTIRVL